MLIPIDFEFFNTTENELHLVCCSLEYRGELREYWLADGSDTKKLKKDLKLFREEGCTFVAYSAEAEVRSFLALGIDHKKWIDLYLEYLCLSNHSHEYMYGKQLIQGKVKTTKPPKKKWEMTEEDKRKADGQKAEKGLAAACFKVLNIQIDTDFKDETRKLILSKDLELIQENKQQIIDYCSSDIKHLIPLYIEMVKEYKKRLGVEFNLIQLNAEMETRADYSRRTAKMVALGYPIDPVATKAFSDSVSDILFELQEEINSLFPDILPFEKDSKRYYTWKQKRTRDWIKSQNFRRWRMTDGGKKGIKDYSLSLEAFTDHFDYKHTYPKDNFGAQMVRYLKTKQNLNGFLPAKSGDKKKKKFWDYVGSDDRVRPHFGIYGAQSSRSQPAATGFIPLKSAWMRALIYPKSGRAVCGIDYSSEEFFLAALQSKDPNMVKAYLSGDPYLYFAKLSGAVPWDGTKAKYADIRELFKSTTLGLSYLMTKVGLAKKLTADTGKKVTEEDAELYILRFDTAYPKYAKYRKAVIADYRKNRKLKLPCGWYMWGDNRNDRSVANCPTQGLGASIMRKAVELAQEAGLDVIFTLHDAIYIEFDSNDFSAIDTLAECMREAFCFYFEGKVKEIAKKIRMEADIWSPDYPEGIEEFVSEKGIPVKRQHIYIDPRAKDEYHQFKKYFSPINYDEVI